MKTNNNNKASPLLIEDNSLMINPILAAMLGINTAVILHQTQYWIQSQSKKIEGRYWFYKTNDGWTEEIFYLCEKTIRNSIKKLEDLGIVISEEFNRSKGDRTKWYTIDYKKLDQLYLDYLSKLNMEG